MTQEFHITGRGIAWHSTDNADEDYTESINWPLMQFTGLHDKNGKEIYEGDVVRCQGGEYSQGFREYDVTGIIKYSNSASFDVVSKDEIYYSFGYSNWDSVEVIGNIFSNPELINQ